MLRTDRSPTKPAAAPRGRPAADDASTQERLYRAVVSRDARFDGRLFVGVTSTGIYCRPVCRVRTPLRRNCRFFTSAPLAEAAGFRPCLRCRPELAPGLSLVDSPHALALHAARLIDEGVGAGRVVQLPEVAARLGVTDRHLRRVFQEAHGVSPHAYLTTRRLLLAKQLLSDTPLPVTQVAHAAGFASLRRFNAAFAERYRLSPTRLRDQYAHGGAPGSVQEAISVRLPYRPPYDVHGVLRFLRNRQVPGVESVDGLELRRTIACIHQGRPIGGWLAARFEPEHHEVVVRIAPALAPLLGPIVQRLRQALDLDADPALIDPALAALPVPLRAGVRVPGGIDGFEVAARVVLGQQVSIAAARTLTGRLVDALGEAVTTPYGELRRLFPSAHAVAAADPDAIGRLGIVRQRVRALQSLAAAVADGSLALHRGAPLQPTLAALRELPGLGEWSVQLIAMRALAWPDAFSAADIGVQRALGTRDGAAIETLAAAWRPWRAYALMRLWQSLEKAA